MDGEGFVQDKPAWFHHGPDRRKEIALQIACDQPDVEESTGQPRTGEIGAPPANNQPVRARAGGSISDSIELHVDTECAEPGACKQLRMPAPAHREVDRRRPHVVRSVPRTIKVSDHARQPVDHEGRREIVYDPLLAQALLTAVGLGLFGLVGAAVLGLRGTDVGRHISYGFFSTMIMLLAHSMMMFYLIGKGKAVKDAMAEGGLTGDQYRRIAIVRKPVFSVGTLAMAVTMVAAILGASVDTGVLPSIVHGLIAYGAIACNVAALKIELSALAESSRIVDEVNRLLGS
jgi:hypothetical protein